MPMDALPDLSPFTLLDALAVALLVLAALAIGHAVEHPPARRPSVTLLMADYRRAWMRQFVTRSPRIFDATVIDSLRQGTAFFASACMIALGGGIALVGNSERIEGVAADLTLQIEGATVEIKVILVLLFLANALLKFIWAHRLFGYCAILMAAVPNDPEDPQCYPMAARAAEINVTAARNFNRGLRSIYFALAALGWLLGPVALVLTTVVTSAVLIRREFASTSRGLILESPTTPR